MIVAFSTSSQFASVAAIAPDRKLLFAETRDVPRRASEACLEMLESMRQRGLDLEQATLFAADVGPGSFTGVRVGVILAKTFGFVYSVPVAGRNAFDLVAPDRTVFLPSRKGEYFVREVGGMPFRTIEGPLGETQPAPNAANFAWFLDELEPVTAARFLPEYLIEPSISVPNKPFAERSV